MQEYRFGPNRLRRTFPPSIRAVRNIPNCMNNSRRRETDVPLTVREALSTYARRDHHEDWGKLFTEKSLTRYFKKHYKQDFEETDFVHLYQDLMNIYPEKWVVETPFYRLNHATSWARSQFMLENIAAALNQYDAVFIEMGSGHFLDLAQALQKMIGPPQVTDGRQLSPQPVWKDCVRRRAGKSID